MPTEIKDLRALQWRGVTIFDTIMRFSHGVGHAPVSAWIVGAMAAQLTDSGWRASAALDRLADGAGVRDRAAI